MLHYSHRNHYLRHILLNAKSLFPGAIRATSAYYDQHSLGIMINDIDLNEESVAIKEISTSVFDSEHLHQLRKQKLRYSWLSSPFSKESRMQDQLKIQTEYENHTLLIRFPNKTIGLNDLLFVFFKNEEQLFRFTSKTAKLSTELKQSIASVYVRSLDVIRRQIEEDNKINGILSDHIQETEHEELAKSKEKLEKSHKEFLFYKSLIVKKSDEFIINSHYTVEWSDDAVNQLIESSPDINSLEKAVQRALIIAVNEAKQDTRLIKLKVKHLSHIKAPADHSIIETKIIESHKKTYLLLDRYEKAALKVLQSQQNLTGSNLGQQLSPSITAAAISDAIRKHAQKITSLLKEYPNRWEIIRKQFRPIQNKVSYTFNEDQLAS